MAVNDNELREHVNLAKILVKELKVNGYEWIDVPVGNTHEPVLNPSLVDVLDVLAVHGIKLVKDNTGLASAAYMGQLAPKRSR